MRVIDTPGHTKGHIVYYFPTEHVLFAGDTMIARLGDLLRHTLEETNESEITLAREIELLRRYLEIMSTDIPPSRIPSPLRATASVL